MTNHAFSFLAATLVSMVLYGCGANFHSIYRTSEGDKSHIVFTDAKQSATVVQVDKEGVLRACAAKSPDVFSALATSASGAADFAKGMMSIGVSGSGSTAEQASSFGLRTQLTQSQSELLYQLCLQALNGKLSNEQLATELRRYQNTLVTMLAIEQLTGYAKPTVVSLQTGSSTGAAKELLELSKRLDEARTIEKKAAASLEAAKADTKEKEQAANKASEAVKAKKTEQDNQLKPLKDAVEKAEKERDDAKKNGAPDIEAKQSAYDKAVKDRDDKVKAYAEELAPLIKADSDAGKELEDTKAVENGADATLTEATQIQKEREEILKNANRSINTTASGSGSQVTSLANNFYATDNSSVAKDIADVVGEMQRIHLWQSFVADDCLRFLMQEGSKEPLREDKKSVIKLCEKMVEKSTEWRFQNLYLSYGCNIQGGDCSKSYVTHPPSPAFK